MRSRRASTPCGRATTTRSSGTTIGLPDIPGTGDEFPYLHFSVIMNPARRLAWYVAYNVRERSRETERRDKWLPDPTLPRAFQPGNEHYRLSEFDRGHLVSPGTVAWGERRHAQIAMDQAFFWTNTSPQSPAFNQRSWLGLEKREREIAEARGQRGRVQRPRLRRRRHRASRQRRDAGAAPRPPDVPRAAALLQGRRRPRRRGRSRGGRALRGELARLRRRPSPWGSRSWRRSRA